jgi:hypothetical protein
MLKSFTKREVILRALLGSGVPAFWFTIVTIPTFAPHTLWFDTLWSVITIAVTLPAFIHRMDIKHIIVTYTIWLMIWFGLGFWVWGAIMMAVYFTDWISRMCEYHYFYKLLDKYPKKEVRVAAYLRSSICQRAVARQLGKLLGSNKTSKFYAKHYKWYDIIPDGLFQALPGEKRARVFTKQWWKMTMFGWVHYWKHGMSPI